MTDFSNVKTVKCVDDRGVHLTYGKIYDVLGYNGWDDRLKIKNDRGMVTWLSCVRFVAAETIVFDHAPVAPVTKPVEPSFRDRFVKEIKERLTDIANDKDYREDYDLEGDDEAVTLIDLAETLGLTVEIESSSLKIEVH